MSNSKTEQKSEPLHNSGPPQHHVKLHLVSLTHKYIDLFSTTLCIHIIILIRIIIVYIVYKLFCLRVNTRLRTWWDWLYYPVFNTNVCFYYVQTDHTNITCSLIIISELVHVCVRASFAAGFRGVGLHMHMVHVVQHVTALTVLSKRTNND